MRIKNNLKSGDIVDGKKNTRKSKLLRALWLFYIVNAVVFTSLPVDMLIKSGFKDESKIMHLEDDWDININGKEYQDVALKEFSFDTLTKGDTLEMKTTLPKDWKYEDAVMCFHTRQATVELFVDNELIYEYGNERRDAGKTVGSGLLFISMFEEYKGKDIKIILSVSETDAFSKLDEVWISEWHDSYRYVITQNRFPMFIGFFLFLFGIVIAFVGISTLSVTMKNWDIFYIAIFSIAIGMWTLCYHNCIMIFSLPLYSISLLEYMSLLIAPLPIIGYLRKYTYSLESKTYKTIYNVLYIAQIIFTVFLILFHSTDMVHAAATLPYYHATLIISIVFFSNVVYKSMKKKTNNKKLIIAIIVSLALTVCCIGYDLILYIMNRYIGMELPKIPALSTIGVIIFVVLLVVDFVFDVNENLLEKQEKELLLQKAYTDDLTKINNRLYCSEYMNKIAKEEKFYSIICFDVNGLKEINDTHGHSKGDMLIKNAAKVISDVYCKVGIVGRMGGDEFISIMKIIDVDEINSLIDNFNKRISEFNDMEEEIRLSIAYGFALSTEIDNSTNFEKVYNLADNRMYANKKQMKKID